MFVLVMALLPGQAGATYYPKLHPTAEEAVPQSQLPPAPPGVAGTLAEMNIYLEGCLPIDEAWDLHLVPFRGTDTKAGGMGVLRLLDAPEHPAQLRHVYKANGLPVYLGIGYRFDKHNEWTAKDEVFTFLAADGIRLLDSHELFNDFSTGVFTVDIDGDGKLDLVCPTTAGVSASGMVEILTVQPDGMITVPGDDAMPRVLDSAYGKCELQDFNRDGRWELETYHTYRYDGPDTDYFLALYEYNPATGMFQDVLGAYPEQYEDYQAFYREFAAALTTFIAEPESFVNSEYSGSGPVCRINGHWHPLNGWTADDRDAINRYIGNWDVTDLIAIWIDPG